jgi:hypothetical protein
MERTIVMLKQLARFKVHLVFATAFAGALLLGTVAGMVEGAGPFPALWQTIKAVRPFEWIMLIAFWYYCATQKVKEDQFTDSRLTELGLSHQK